MKGPKFHATLANRAGVATTMAVCVEVDPEGWNGYMEYPELKRIAKVCVGVYTGGATGYDGGGSSDV